MLTGKEILKQTDIRSPRTLRRWAERGLLPKPQVKNVPSGRGRASFWPDWVLPRCQRIKQLLKAGKSLDEILEILGNDWKTERAKSRRRYRFAEVSADLDFEAAIRNLAELIGNKLVPFLGGLGADVRRAVYSLDTALFQKETIENLLGLVRQGINPLLVYTNGQFHFTADFMVGQLVGHDTEHSGPSIVMSVFGEVVTAFAAIKDDLPSTPAITSVPRVVKTDGAGLKEFHVHPVGEMDFELSPADDRSNPAEKEQ